VVAACLVAAAGLAAGCGRSEVKSPTGRPVAGGTITVRMVTSPATVGQFQPAVVTVRPDQKVAWVNASPEYHTVTFVSGDVPSSLALPPGGSFETVFHRPGTHRYVCDYHAAMVGEVRVVGTR